MRHRSCTHRTRRRYRCAVVFFRLTIPRASYPQGSIGWASRPRVSFVGQGMESVKIIAFSTAAAIVYGVLHDQFTAYICVEYFSVAHPPVFATRSPFWLALGWGVIATWWVGLSLGLLLATGARAGPPPRLTIANVRSPILWLMLFTAIAALVSGCFGAYLRASGQISVPMGWGAIIPPDKQVAFTADCWAHLASYGFGIVGGIFVIAITIRRRARRRAEVSLVSP
jgi:hypothetical protein